MASTARTTPPVTVGAMISPLAPTGVQATMLVAQD
jgi:hypothetical protein